MNRQLKASILIVSPDPLALPPLTRALLGFLGQLSPNHPFPAALLADAELELRQRDGFEPTPVENPLAELQQGGWIHRLPDGDSFCLTEAGRRLAAAVVEDPASGEADDALDSSYSNLGLLLHEMGRSDEAVGIFRGVLRRAEQRLGQNHSDLAPILNNLAAVLMALGRLDEVEPLIRSNVASAEILDPPHPALAVRLFNLASFLQKAGRPAEAEPIFRRVLELEEAKYGPEHSEIFSTLLQLGKVLVDLQRGTEALELFERALEIHAKWPGTEGVEEIGDDIAYLAELAEEAGRPNEAIHLQRRALQIAELEEPEDLDLIADRLDVLSSALLERGHPEEAEPLLRRRLAILEAQMATSSAHPPSDSLQLAAARYELGGTLYHTTCYDEAEGLLRQALATEEQIHGPGHRASCKTLKFLAATLQARGELAEAEVLNRRALDLAEAFYGPAEVASCLNNLGTVLRDLGRMDEAEIVLRRSIRVCDSQVGTEIPMMAVAFANLAYLCQIQQRYEVAITLMQRAVEIEENLFGESSPEVAKRLLVFANLLLDMNHPVEAQAQLERALTIRQEHFGPKAEPTLKICRRLDEVRATTAPKLFERARAAFKVIRHRFFGA